MCRNPKYSTKDSVKTKKQIQQNVKIENQHIKNHWCFHTLTMTYLKINFKKSHLTRKPKGHWFDSRSGYMPGLWVQSLIGTCVRGNQSVFFFHIDISLPFSLPAPLSKKYMNIFLKVPFIIGTKRIKCLGINLTKK